MITKDEIKVKVSTNPNWAARAVVALHNRQTAAEQEVKGTADLNGRGFNATDAAILSSFAEQVKKGRNLSEKQLAIAYKKLPKYAGQLLQIAGGDK